MIKIEGLNHIYKDREDEAVKNIDLEIKKGEIVAILGISGSGKTTLLKSINRLVEPNKGRIEIDGVSVMDADKKSLRKIRQNVGMIFQQFNLIERASVLDNVLKGRLSYNSTLKTSLNRFKKEDHDIAMDCLKRVGMDGFAHKKVQSLSGGEKQRIAIARALAQKPSIILADEPVSSLDPRLRMEVMDLLKKICKEDNITLLISMHFLELVRGYTDRCIGMKNGEIIFNSDSSKIGQDDVIKIFGFKETDKEEMIERLKSLGYIN
jgi:phosphonate transport system ATP-binding protein